MEIPDPKFKVGDVLTFAAGATHPLGWPLRIPARLSVVWRCYMDDPAGAGWDYHLRVVDYPPFQTVQLNESELVPYPEPVKEEAR